MPLILQMSKSHRDMKSEPNREEALFQAAAQLSGAERAFFLDGACYGDSALRLRLEALLAARKQTDSYLDTQVEMVRPAIRLDLANAPDEGPGTVN
jgi:hypothetical protein